MPLSQSSRLLNGSLRTAYPGFGRRSIASRGCLTSEASASEDGLMNLLRSICCLSLADVPWKNQRRKGLYEVNPLCQKRISVKRKRI